MENPYQQFITNFDDEVSSVENQLYGCTNNGINLEQPSTSGNTKIRLRPIESVSDSDILLKSLNTKVLRILCHIQSISSIVIIACQVLLYATVTRGFYKPVDYVGIGLWGPIFFFSLATGLTYLTLKEPNGCIIGTAMGFQIVSIIFCIILLTLSIISLIMHGSRYYNPEIPGSVFCSLMIFCSVCEIATAMFISIYFCRVVCCGRKRMVRSVLFDVETERQS